MGGEPGFRLRRTLAAAAVAHVTAFCDRLAAHAQPQESAERVLDAPLRLAPSVDRRKVAGIALVVVAVAALLAFTGGPAEKFVDAFSRVAAADPDWVVAGIAFEALSFAGYIALFWLVAGGATAAVGLRASAEVSLAGAAATRLLPTGGLGGVALTLWALARSGLPARAAVRTLLTFLVLLYAVFVGALTTAAVLLLTGAVPSHGPALLAAPSALLGLTAAAAALWLARRRATVFGEAVWAAVAIVRRADARLLGALAWWGFDLALLAAMFAAIDSPPAVPVLMLAYFTGAIGNTVPLPGLVAGGTTGVLLAFGVDAAVALPAVLGYRAIALWVPAALGTFAIAALRRTVHAWGSAPAMEVTGHRGPATISLAP